MKAKTTSTLDEELPSRMEAVAPRKAGEPSCTVAEHPEGSFSQRWRGQLHLADRDDERYRALAKRYL